MEMSPITTAGVVGTKSALVKRMALMLGVVVLIAAAIVGYKAFTGSARQAALRAQGGALQTISTIVAATQAWTPELAAVGSLRAVNGADLSLEVSGIVEDIAFNSGDDVEAGTVLLRLKAADDLAKLQSLQAMEKLAAVTYDRNMRLRNSQHVSQATLDTNEANLKNARALVAQQQAMIEKKTLRAPLSGHLGLRAVDKGQYLNAGTTIVTLQALDPIFIDFFLPQQDLDRIKTGQGVAARIDTYPGRDFPGEIIAINPKVDAANRNVQVRASFKNADHKLFPGMYATVKVAAGDINRYITLPQTSVVYSPYGDAVYIVDKKTNDKGEEQLVARYSFVTLGETRGDIVAVLSGVKEGETVVTAGQIKLRNGAPVKIDNTVQPSMDASPKPAKP
ncbi:MAG: efflux RND transporter periplasmic adaptor subunit [Rhodospirillaceae bacterium]|nr:efflux RND transporter periplasmic adaptor subunit [Rhodospirillaceae bacterium]